MALEVGKELSVRLTLPDGIIFTGNNVDGRYCNKATSTTGRVKQELKLQQD